MAILSWVGARAEASIVGAELAAGWQLGADGLELTMKDQIKALEEQAKQTSVEIHIVSNETTEGVQFDNIGGVGGILRFAMA